MSAIFKKHHVKFFFDVISPYTYFAYHVVQRYTPLWDLDVDFQPMFLGGVMHGSGNKPPGTVPSKGKYLSEDTARNKEFFGLTNFCSESPTNFFDVAGDLRMMRVLTCAKATQDDQVASALRDLAFETYWGARRGENPSEILVNDDVIAEICKEAGIADIAAFLEDAYSPTNKKRLADATHVAIEQSAFGSPTMYVHKKGTTVDEAPAMFFGSDRFEQMAHYLEESWFGPTGQRAAL